MSEGPPPPYRPDDDPLDPVVLPPDATQIQPPHLPPPPPPPPPDLVPDEEDPEESHLRRYLPWYLMAALGVLILAGLGIWLLTRSSDKPVPAVVGLHIDQAVTRLQNDGFKTQIARQSNVRAAGIVFGQNPAAATERSKGSTVDLLVSKGPSSATVPNAVGLSQSDARSALVKAGFQVTSAQVFSDQPTGDVVAQDPAAGSHMAPGSRVRLNISKGSATTAVPSEVGSPVTQAQSALAAKGFRTSVTRVPSDQPVDTVVAQSPTGGQAPRGSNVHLNVSRGQPTTTATSTTTVTTPTTPTTTTTTTGTTTTDTTTTNTTTSSTSGSPG